MGRRARTDQPLNEERWRAHREKHADLAAQLSEYKAGANEWRATLNELRNTGVTRAEYVAEHKGLRTELVSYFERLEARVDALERLVQGMADRDTNTRQLLSSARNLIILGFIITGGLIGIAAYLRP